MAMQLEPHQFKGMQRDLSVSKISNEFLYDAMNIRITARNDNTLLSITNEKGNKEIPLKTNNVDVSILGTVIGHNVLNNYVVLFTTNTGLIDRIYRLEYKDSYFEVVLLYEGLLNLNVEHPIESISIYEKEDVQKVYWVDGINPVRFINIAKTNHEGSSDVFNFVQNLKLDEVVNIRSNPELKGSFPSGVVQYVFTYYNKYGSESNIFYHSPLFYSHRVNRGGSPEETSTNSFSIEISELDSNFEYLRIYSIVRTSLDAVPTVRRVVDLKVKGGSISYTDTNTLGNIVDPSLLLYLGGENIVPECITHKDNTLFLGNYTLPNNVFSKEIKEWLSNNNQNITFSYKTVKEENKYELRSGIYDYSTQLNQNSYDITTFKSKETYRFGIQFQNRIGRWSEVLWVNDAKVDKTPYANVPTSAASSNSKMYNSLVKASYVLPDTLLQEARRLGYIRARGVIVYPNASEREVICQGVLNPTVYKYDDRYNEEGGISNYPYAQSSWFFRPYVKPRNSIPYVPNIDSTYGSVATYTHGRKVNYSSYDGINRSFEIGIDLSNKDHRGQLINKDFYVDANVVTMHSPDIEFLDSIDSLLDSTLKCSIVGYININNNIAFRDVQASTTAANTSDYGFYEKFPSSINSVYSSAQNGGGILISGINWFGHAVDRDDDTWKVVGKNIGWLISPWQRSGSLVNDFAKRPDGFVVSKLKHNRLINTRVSYNTEYSVNWTPVNGISSIGVFDSNEQSIVYISNDTENASVSRLSYYGNIDKILTPGGDSRAGCTIEAQTGTMTRSATSGSGLLEENPDDTAPDDNVADGGGGSSGRNTINELYRSGIIAVSEKDYIEDGNYKYSRNPVSMKYKSTKHVVFRFNNSGTSTVILPALEGAEEKHCEDNLYNVEYATLSTNHNAILWLAELYREVNKDVKFGGTTEDALLNNRWHIAGNPVCINKENVTVEYLQGDTYFQRYDCMKTYPYTLEDENSVTEILSFYCETRVNIDGRYDRNRRSFNNLALTNINFNLLNPVYSQSNNFFNYFILDDTLNSNTFRNQITWSKEKSLGEEIDQWTNITLASTLDMDGDKGNVNALKTFNNEIYCFQDSGFSNILFNSRVQVPTSDGVPIEISNGFKVQGKRYISNVIGCTNKYSIVSTSSGLYFIDNNGNSLYRFNGQIQSLSNSLGFNQWVEENNSYNKWNPIEFDNIISYYDNSEGDVYFVNNKQCLVFSELLNLFTSFMSYESIYPFFNIKNKLFSMKDNKVWKHNEGDYNMFYGKFKPYYVTIISNSNHNVDKTYNTVEFRADSWDNNNLLSHNTFDTLEVWNEYQKGKSCLEFKYGYPSNLKKKFRVWRANIPRDSHNMRDRIRNTWAYIKLGMNNSNTWKTVLHDISVHYFL